MVAQQKQQLQESEAQAHHLSGRGEGDGSRERPINIAWHGAVPQLQRLCNNDRLLKLLMDRGVCELSNKRVSTTHGEAGSSSSGSDDPHPSRSTYPTPSTTMKRQASLKGRGTPGSVLNLDLHHYKNGIRE